MGVCDIPSLRPKISLPNGFCHFRSIGILAYAVKAATESRNWMSAGLGMQLRIPKAGKLPCARQRYRETTILFELCLNPDLWWFVGGSQKLGLSD